jgi:hypothetical protein
MPSSRGRRAWGATRRFRRDLEIASTLGVTVGYGLISFVSYAIRRSVHLRSAPSTPAPTKWRSWSADWRRRRRGRVIAGGAMADRLSRP